MDFHDIGTVLQSIFYIHCLVWQFAEFAYWHETAIQHVGQGGTKNKTTRLDADHALNTSACVVSCKTLHGSMEGCAILEQWCNVLEQNPRLWEIGDVANPIF